MANKILAALSCAALIAAILVVALAATDYPPGFWDDDYQPHAVKAVIR